MKFLNFGTMEQNASVMHFGMYDGIILICACHNDRRCPIVPSSSAQHNFLDDKLLDGVATVIPQLDGHSQSSNKVSTTNAIAITAMMT